MLATGGLVLFRDQHLEAGHQFGPRVGRVDDVVHIAPFSSHVRVGEPLRVLVNQFGPASRRIVGVLKLAAVHDLPRPLGSHHG